MCITNGYRTAEPRWLLIPRHEAPTKVVSALAEAARLFSAAGTKALRAGRADRAITMLTCACNVLTFVEDPVSYATALGSLLEALVEAGRASSAVSLTITVTSLECTEVNATQIALLLVQLARADAVAGNPAHGIARIQDARALLPPVGSQSIATALEGVEAHLLTEAADADSDRTAETLARHVLDITRDTALPHISCQAWHVLGILARQRDLTESTACFRQVRLHAQSGFPFWRLRAQVELGINEWLSTGVISRLRLARKAAERSGAVALGYTADTVIALDLVFRGGYVAAAQLIDRCQAAAEPEGLLETLRWLALAKSVLAAHRCRRAEMEAALAEFRERGGEASRIAPLAPWLAETICALLEEDIARAREAVARSLSRQAPWPSAAPEALQRLLERLPAMSRYASGPVPANAPEATQSWSAPLIGFERAAALGQNGHESAALAAFAQAEVTSARYGLAGHLGIRLVAEAASNHGWGHPVVWLRRAEEYFRDQPAIAVTHACRRLLRQAGAPVPQRRSGAHHIPQQLQALGVTVREYEVLQILTPHVRNRDIAAELHISPRTVEKHIGSLLVKTGQRGRLALSSFAAGVSA